MIDFTVAFLGCFLAGMVAVPIVTDDLNEFWFILRVAQAHLVLTTDSQLKTLTKTLKAKSIDFPKDVDCQATIARFDLPLWPTLNSQNRSMAN
ncbi:hypothetical protein G6F68_017316 [Rhizopus microsporus]|nr:hypothetical protein G6F68_017316 [Rhizopus microsporus]